MVKFRLWAQSTLWYLVKNKFPEIFIINVLQVIAVYVMELVYQIFLFLCVTDVVPLTYSIR